MFEQMKGRVKRSKVEGLSTMMEDILGHGGKTEFYVKYKGNHCRILKAREECDEIITENFPFAALCGVGDASMGERERQNSESGETSQRLMLFMEARDRGGLG